MKRRRSKVRKKKAPPKKEKLAPIAGTISTSVGELEVIDVVSVMKQVIEERGTKRRERKGRKT